MRRRRRVLEKGRKRLLITAQLEDVRKTKLLMAFFPLLVIGN